jgi:SIR2-like domain
MNAKKHLLLTGAGFTKNFGAPLAAELWSIILGCPYLRNYPKVLDVLRENFDFEAVYRQVLDGDFSDAEKEWLTRSVQYAYAYIDSVIQDILGSGIHINGLQAMINRFAGDRLQPGFFFTLNQDLFLERHYYNGQRPLLPGIPHKQHWFTSEFNTGIQPSDVSPLPASVPGDFMKGSGFFYIKLHGSMNWYSSVGSGQKLIIGQGKDAQINAEPILARYMELFREVLCGGEHKLLVIGYSFADPHINRVLMDSVKKGLQLFVLSPGSPETLKNRMASQDCAELWSALVEYFPFDFKTLFPADQSVTAQWKHVRASFFDDRHGLG